MENTARRVTAAVIERDGRILLARRAPGQSHAGKWEFPGGKVEPGESDKMCLERELREEFGIGGEAGDYVAESLYRYERGAILLIAYRYDWRAGDLRLTVHDRVAWVLPGELATYDLTPADLPVARAASAMKPV